MSKKIAVNGDITTTGAVLMASTSRFFCGTDPAALLGDSIFCPLCKSEGKIIEGARNFILDGKPAAYDGCLVACNCPIGKNRIIATKSTLFVNVPESAAETKIFSSSNLKEEEKPFIDEKLSFVDNRKYFDELISNNSIQKLNNENEFIQKDIEFIVMKNGIKHKYTISHTSYNDLILYYEGYSNAPYVPLNSDTSGITLGYGYDLGHQSKDTAFNELSQIYPAAQVSRLIEVIGKKGSHARKLLSSVIDITISKEDAKHLSIVSKSRYAQRVVDIYPESIELSTDQKGALLSLIYNRGNSLKGDRRAEMREIQLKLRNNELQDIPNLLRAMKRLWEGTNQNGLLKRREHEAQFFEKGME